MLALAQASVDAGVGASLVCSELPMGLERQASAADVTVHVLNVEKGGALDVDELASLATAGDSASVVIDGYHFPPSYYERMAAAAPVVAAVDDIAHQPFPVDVLVNASPGARRLVYDVPSGCRLLLGVEYAMLRRQFRTRRRQLEASGGPRTSDVVGRILVFMGGGDPSNETEKALRALRRVGYAGRVDVLVGAANPHGESVRREAEKVTGDASVRSNVTDMAALLCRQDLAVCAAGGTTWELACLGVPMLQIVVADNQEAIAEDLSDRSVCEYAGRRESVDSEDLARRLSGLMGDPDRRSEMVRRGWELVDGRGAVRIVDALQQERSVGERKARL